MAATYVRWQWGTARIHPLLQRSTDISCPPGSQHQHVCCSGPMLGQTDRPTDTVPFHRPCSAHYVGSANKTTFKHTLSDTSTFGYSWTTKFDNYQTHVQQNHQKVQRPVLHNILRWPYDNAKVTIHLRWTSNFTRLTWRTQGFSWVQFACKIVRSSEAVFVNWLTIFLKEILPHHKLTLR